MQVVLDANVFGHRFLRAPENAAFPTSADRKRFSPTPSSQFGYKRRPRRFSNMPRY
jgi:hypothetical protein